MDTIITRDGAELFYKDWGEGQPVLFSHAWPFNADMWDGQMQFLAARGYRCIAYDRRGFGRSSQPWSGYGFDVFADDLASLIHSLDLLDTVLVGGACGGGDVVRYVARHGDRRVDKIVLLSTLLPQPCQTHDGSPGLDHGVFDDMEAALVADRPEFLRELHWTLFADGRANTSVSEGARQWLFGMAMQAGPQALAGCLAATRAAQFSDDLAGLTATTLVLHGGADALAPVESTAGPAAALLAAGRLAVIEGAPHGLWFTHREQVNAALLSFIAEDSEAPRQ